MKEEKSFVEPLVGVEGTVKAQILSQWPIAKDPRPKMKYKSEGKCNSKSPAAWNMNEVERRRLYVLP